MTDKKQTHLSVAHHSLRRIRKKWVGLVTRRACEAVLAIAKSLEAGDQSLVLAVKASVYGLDMPLDECDSPIALMRLSLARRTAEGYNGLAVDLCNRARVVTTTRGRDTLYLGRLMVSMEDRICSFYHRPSSVLSDAEAVVRSGIRQHGAHVDPVWRMKFCCLTLNCIKLDFLWMRNADTPVEPSK
jgi:hypothetical protein